MSPKLVRNNYKMDTAFLHHISSMPKCSFRNPMDLDTKIFHEYKKVKVLTIS